jgi:nonsense-mediated mRNA decay protein 3
MYCVECGSEEKLYDNLCETCFTKKTIFFGIPKVVHITICPTCSAWEKSHHWENSDSEEASIIQQLNDQVTIKKGVKYMDISLDLKPYKTNVYLATVDVTGIYDDLKVKDKLESEIRVSYNTCGRCSRLSGSYFEAIIQVRSTNRPVTDSELVRAEEIVDEVLSHSQSVESNAFLSKCELIHGGEDFYIGSSNVARQIAKRLVKEFSGKLGESSSLAGRKDGREIHRVTYTIRIPEFKPGDFIKLDGKIFKVIRLTQKRIMCLYLKTGESRGFSHDEVEHGKSLGGNELIHDAVLVLESQNEVQILDPDNYRTVDLVKPKNLKVSGETVKIFKADEDIYLLPEPIEKKGKKI